MKLDALTSSPPVDDSMPPMDMPPEEIATPDGFTIPTDLADSAGLADLTEGDTFTVTITGKVTANDPATGITATLMAARNGKRDIGGDFPEEEEESAEFTRPKSKVELGPSADEDWKK